MTAGQASASTQICIASVHVRSIGATGDAAGYRVARTLDATTVARASIFPSPMQDCNHDSPAHVSVALSNLGGLMRTLALSLLLCSTAAVAGLKEGYEALSRKDYVTAANEYRPLADRGNAEAQYRIGRMYEFGNGYPQDKAQGIAWIR